MTKDVITLVGLGQTLPVKRLCWVLAIFVLAAHTVKGRDWKTACPTAAAEATQLLSAQPAPKNEPNVTRPALREELLQMEKVDQEAREIWAAGGKMGDSSNDDPALLHLRDIDTINLQKLKHIVTQDGFPTVKMVGHSGMEAAFILTQHADPRFQAKTLPIVAARFKQGELSGQDYALLTDRVLRAQGKPQRYGSQVTWTDQGWKPEPIADEAHVDERRHALGMMSMANYSCMLSAMYGSPHS